MANGVSPDEGTVPPATGTHSCVPRVQVRRCVAVSPKLWIAVALFATAFLPSRSAAQLSVPVTLTANVEGGTTIQATHLVFGEITPGGTVSVPAQPIAGPGSPGRIAVQSNVTLVTVAIPSRMTLSGPGGQIVAQLECGYAASVEAPEVTSFDCGSGFSFQPVSGKQHVIFVGGSIGARETASKTAGAYTGTVTVTATYSSS